MLTRHRLTFLCTLVVVGSLGQEVDPPPVTPVAVYPPTPSPGTASPPADSSAGKNPASCALHILDFKLREYMNKEVKDSGAVLFEIHMHMVNYSVDPLRTEVSQNYKPWLWHMTRSRHGRTLLMLSFHYDILSMNILKMGVDKLHLQVEDKPHGCLESLPSAERLVALRNLLLSQGGGEAEYVCIQVIRRSGSTGEFVHNCCHEDPTSHNVFCDDQMDDVWISTLYIAVAIIKVMAFCFCPLVLPSTMYSALYLATEYVVKLTREVKMKLFISEQMDCPVKYKRRLTLEDVHDWKRFRAAIETLPYDQIIPIKMSELRIKVKGKRIIPENKPPTGLMRTMYDNLIRCKIKRLDPFTECCESSVFAAMEPKFRHKLSWYKCVQGLISVLMLFLIPLPYYIRLIIFYKFEYNEVADRRAAMSRLGLSETFFFYKTNVMQYFTPTHSVFVAAYCLYFLAGLFIGLSEIGVREKLKTVTRSSLQDMASVSQVSVLSVLIRVFLWPFRKCGLLALLLAPMYAFVALPFCTVVFVLYCIPTIYLSYRLLLHSHRQFGNVWVEEHEEQRKKFRRLQQLSKRLKQMDKNVHREKEGDSDGGCMPSCPEGGCCSSLRSLSLQVTSGAFCLCVLYALALIFAESFSLLVEVIAFTLMGIIVNAGRTLKYVTMVVLVFVYMHDCYSNVYETYLDFNKTVLEEIVGRVDDDLRKHAALPSAKQGDAAFQARTVDDDIYIPTNLSIKKREIRWCIGHLMLFLDSLDTPRIPLRFFKRACEIRIHGAPGPVYRNLIWATGRFLIIVIFLLFVMIVVMAFGNVTEMSSTNQTMATLAGGFVPMLLKNVLSSKGKKLSLKTVSFKGQVDEILGEYKQHWPVTDMDFQQYDPAEEAEKEKEKEENKDGENQDKKKDSDKKKSEDRKDSKVGVTEKTPTFNGAEAKEQKTKETGVAKVDMNGPLLGAKAEEAVLAAEGGSMVQLSDHVMRFSSKPPGVTGSVADLLGPAPPTSEEEDMVDIFVDLSAAEAGMWIIHNSMESLPRGTGLMPDYFRPPLQTQPQHQPDSPV